jgi:hypothetical protein
MKEIKNFVYKTEGIYLDRIECCNYDCRAIIITKMTLKKFVELYVREHTHTPFYGVRVVSIEQGSNWFRINQYLKDQDPFGYDYDSSTYKTYSPKLIISLYKDKIDTEEDTKLYSYPLYLSEDSSVFKDSKFLTEKHENQVTEEIRRKVASLREEGKEAYLRCEDFTSIKKEVKFLNQLAFLERVKLTGVKLDSNFTHEYGWFLNQENMEAAIATSSKVIKKFPDDLNLLKKFSFAIHYGDIATPSEHWESFSVDAGDWIVTE